MVKTEASNPLGKIILDASPTEKLARAKRATRLAVVALVFVSATATTLGLNSQAKTAEIERLEQGIAVCLESEIACRLFAADVQSH
jgi:hypothetical protein